MKTFAGNNGSEYVEFTEVEFHPLIHIVCQQTKSVDSFWWYIYYVSSKTSFCVGQGSEDKNKAVNQAAQIAENVLYQDNPAKYARKYYNRFN